MEVSLAEYADRLFGGEDDLLRQMRLEAEQEGVPTIQVPTDLGRLLTFLISQMQARRVLEIGTLFGYSTVVMARAMPDDGTLTTLELSPKHAELAQRNLERAGVAPKVTILHGPALQTLETLAGREFDLVFIDANKDGYPQYLEHALRLTRPGSIIVADNVWRQGAVADPSEDNVAAVFVAEFNRMLAAEPRLTNTIVPTRDGEDAATVSVVR